MKSLLICIGLCCCCIASAQAASLTTPSGNRLVWSLPAGWQQVAEPPDELLREIALHIGHDAARQGQKPTDQQLLRLAMKRLAANELLLYHTRSGAWISFDFSPLHAEEVPPDQRTLERSAAYALESLQNEEEVSGLQGDQVSFPLEGAPGTSRLSADYRQHEILTSFSGLIGYLPGEWFFIYATSYPGKVDLRTEIDELFARLRFKAVPTP